MSYDTDNVFAKILRNAMPCVRVYETDKTLAFMDIMPQAEGHVLVIPKHPSENIFTLPPDYVAALAKSVQICATAVKKALKAEGVLIAQLNGTAAGQTVFHIHTHIIPRKHGLDLTFHAKDMVESKILQETANKIIHALKE